MFSGPQTIFSRGFAAHAVIVSTSSEPAAAFTTRASIGSLQHLEFCSRRPTRRCLTTADILATRSRFASTARTVRAVVDEDVSQDVLADVTHADEPTTACRCLNPERGQHSLEDVVIPLCRSAIDVSATTQP